MERKLFGDKRPRQYAPHGRSLRLAALGRIDSASCFP